MKNQYSPLFANAIHRNTQKYRNAFNSRKLCKNVDTFFRSKTEDGVLPSSKQLFFLQRKVSPSRNIGNLEIIHIEPDNKSLRPKFNAQLSELRKAKNLLIDIFEGSDSDEFRKLGSRTQKNHQLSQNQIKKRRTKKTVSRLKTETQFKSTHQQLKNAAYQWVVKQRQKKQTIAKQQLLLELPLFVGDIFHPIHSDSISLNDYKSSSQLLKNMTKQAKEGTFLKIGRVETASNASELTEKLKHYKNMNNLNNFKKSDLRLIKKKLTLKAEESKDWDESAMIEGWEKIGQMNEGQKYFVS